MSLSQPKRYIRSSIIVLGISMLFSVSSGDQKAANQATLNAEKMIIEAKASAPLISVTELNELMASDQPFGLIDIRSESEFEAGYLKGAELVTRSVLEFAIQVGALGPDKRKLVLYCRSGNRSALAIKTLLELGFTDVRHLDGGFIAWTEAGLPFYNGLGIVKVVGTTPER